MGFTPQGLANIARAFATAGQLDAPLFAALARAAEQRMSDLNPQEPANMAWAFATVCQSDALLFAALARTAEQCIGKFREQEVKQILWAQSRHETLTDACSLFEHAGTLD